MDNALKRALKDAWRYKYTRKMRQKLINKQVIIVSSNCVGGMLAHDLRLPFYSPTVNLTIPNFVSFCEHLYEFILEEPRDAGLSNEGYPIAKIGGGNNLKEITINCVHYLSFAEFSEQYNRRRKRMIEKQSEGYSIVIIGTDAQLHEENAVERFHQLPYKKICFTSKKINYPEFITVLKFKDNSEVGDLTQYSTFLKQSMLFEDATDMVSFINNSINDNKT